MADNSAIVGVLRVLLQSETADYVAGVKDAEKTTASLSKSFSNLAKDLSGAKVTERAMEIAAAMKQVGDVSKLTARELTTVAATVNAATEKLRLMGKDVPPEIAKLSNEIKNLQAAKPAASAAGELGTAFGTLQKLAPVLTVGGLATAVIGLGKAALDTADQVVTLSNKTGISYEQIQRMQFVAEQTGTSLETLTAASFKLGQNLSKGTQEARDAVKDLGLSFDELKTQTPEQQFNAVMQALEGVEDVTERNRLGVQLFGKGFADMATAVADGYTEIASQAGVMSDAQIKALERAGDAWAKFKRDLMIGVGSIMASFATAIDQIEKGADSLTNVQKLQLIVTSTLSGKGYLAALQEIGKAQEALRREGARTADITLPAATKATATYSEELAKAKAAVAGLSDVQKKELNAAIALGGDAAKDYALQIGIGAQGLELYKQGVKGTSDAQRKQAQAAQEAEAFTISWSKSLTQAAEQAKKDAAAFDAWLTKFNKGLTTTPEALVKGAEALNTQRNASLIKNAGIRLEAEKRASTEIKQLTLSDHVFQLDQLQQEGEAAKQAVDTKVAGWKEAYAAIDAETAAKMGQVTATYVESIEDMKAQTVTLQSVFVSSFGKIPGLVQAAFTGGGGLTGAFKALGSDIGSTLLGDKGPFGFGAGGALNALGNKLTSGMTNVFGKSIGNAFGLALPGIGSAIGALAGPLIGKLAGLFGVSPEIKKAREDLVKFQKDTISTMATATQKLEAGNEQWKLDVIVVRDAYLATGRTAAEAEKIVSQMWNTDDPKAAAAALAEVNKVLAEQKKHFEENQKAATGLFDEVLKAADELGTGLPDNLRSAVNELDRMGLLTDDLRKKFAALGTENDVDWKRMKEAADKYGISVDSLGPKFQGARLAADAKEIWNSFQMLTKGGADVGGVLFGMREEISALVRESRKFGTTIPEQFRPLIQELEQSGNLLDENGEAIKGIGDLKFGPPIEDQFEKLVKKLDELISKITGPLTKSLVDSAEEGEEAFEKVEDSINKIPRTVAVEVKGIFHPASTSPTETTSAQAGIFRGRFAPQGELAVLHGTESVVPRADERAFAERVLALEPAGGGGTSIVVLPMIPFTDPYMAADEAARQFSGRVRMDSRGMRETIERVIEDYMRTYGE
jgi:hypothetical protein